VYNLPMSSAHSHLGGTDRRLPSHETVPSVEVNKSNFELEMVQTTTLQNIFTTNIVPGPVCSEEKVGIVFLIPP
jgi:hypothetical protein